MHKVNRTFTDGRGRVKVGNIVDGSQYRNLGFLVRRGYLVPIGDDAEPTPREIPEVVEETAEAIVKEAADEVITDEVESEEETVTEPVTFTNNADIIDQLASIPEPVETKPPPKKAAPKRR